MTARRARAHKAIDSFTEIATLRIELKDTDPPIWRAVEVPTSITLKVLHDIVQAAMGWLDYHLWELVIDGQTYGLPMDEDWGTTPRKVASRTRLRDVLALGTTRIAYTYDFGDTWEHSLIISDIRPGDPAIPYPRFIAGERDCPPEDCGGNPRLLRHARDQGRSQPPRSHRSHRVARRLRSRGTRRLPDPGRPRPHRSAPQRRCKAHHQIGKPLSIGPAALTGWIPTYPSSDLAGE